ncbi:MAG: M28 family peptidase, partial [Blastocatellia bacterium]|nr:M28 family peptidase [Blastocatellia bacterium]
MTEGYFGLQVRRIVLSSVLIICCCFAISKVGLTTTEIDDGYNAISENSLRAHLLFLASDLLEGREATTRGYDIAAEYAASVFRQQGLKMLSDRNGEDSFLQVFPVNEVVSRNNETLQVITSNNGSRMVKSFSNKVNFLMGQVDRTVSINAPVVFAGYGLVEKEVGYDDFAGIDVRDKVVVVMAHAPGEGDPNSYFYKSANRNRFFNGEEVLAKRKNAQERGALAILLAEDPLAKHSSLFTNLASNISRKPQNNLRIVTPRRRMRLINEESSRRPIPIIDISPSVVSALFEKTGKSLEGVQKQIATSLKPASFEMIGKQVEILGEVETKLLNTSNVVAMLEGTDPNLRNEYVIIGAHLDHEGTRDGYIWNGADDDSSGSAAVLELAAA